jgi:hypothetical protein
MWVRIGTQVDMDVDGGHKHMGSKVRKANLVSNG